MTARRLAALPTLEPVELCYRRHFALGARFYREPSRAIGWEACVWLWEYLYQHRPASVLDMGAGLSTAVIRTFRSLEAPGMVTWTTDHLPKWLRVAEIELIRDGLPHDHMYHQEQLEWDESLVPPFDLIFLDLNGLPERASKAPLVDCWLAEGGTLILDDWHHASYRETMGAALEARDYAITPEPDSLDEFGRYLARAVRREVPDGLG